MIVDRRPRRGIALVELLVVISVTAILILLCATLIHTFLRLQKSDQALLVEGASLSRLARDLRRDAHASLRAETAAGSAVLDRPDGTRVEYRPREGALDRVERAKGEVRRRESYRLPSRAAAAFEVVEDGGSKLLTMTITRPRGSRRGEDRMEVRVEAAVARYRRLSTSEEDSHASPR
jgi:hypothetical protein